MPQDLLLHAQPRLVHPRRDPLLLLPLPVPPDLRLRHRAAFPLHRLAPRRRRRLLLLHIVRFRFRFRWGSDGEVRPGALRIFLFFRGRGGFVVVGFFFFF